MNGKDKTNEQLSNEQAEMRQRISEFDKVEAEPTVLKELLQRAQMQLQKTIEDALRAMAKMVDTRNPCMAGHQERVANLAASIATEMGLSKQQVTGTLMAASVHDVGHMAVPIEILLKPSGLSEAEMDVIKTHPQVGYDILKTIELAWLVALVVLQHHERMDGSGYPQGLSRKDILLEARILGVADVVGAMVSPRLYRPACDISDALAEILGNSGILYDRGVVNSCVRIIHNHKVKLE